MKNDLEILDKVQKLKTPPFLYTRIEAKINALQEEIFSTKTILGFAFCMIILLGLNIGFIQKNNTFSQSENKTEILIDTYNLNQNNQLYYE